MKRFILYTFLLLLALPALAQTETEPLKQHLVSLRVGGALGSGSFGNADFDDAYPAFVRDGLLLTGSYRYSLGPHVGVGTSVSYRHNRYDLDAFVEPDDELVTGKSSEAWRSWFTLADVYFKVPVRQVMEVYLKGSAGAAFNRSASWQVQTTYGDIRMPADKATAAAWGWGSGVNFITKPFLISLEGSMLYTKPILEVLNTQGNPLRHRQPLNTFNLSVGVLYDF